MLQQFSLQTVFLRLNPLKTSMSMLRLWPMGNACNSKINCFQQVKAVICTL